ncbi:MAG TPA: penicillin acylase family protein [Terriglobia bacterium]|nr:penicillin acylase family protein [Terriglobia bacterium]
MKRFIWRLFFSVLIVLLLTLGGGAVWLRSHTRASLPVLDGAIPVSGISARVEVLRDAHGVPHIRAQSLADALFAQGYVTAQDRLWQMDLSRRNAEGKLSEVFGDRSLRLDIESRTLGFPQVAESTLTDFSPEERRLLDSYTRGVNAFIESHRDRLPLEFLLLRYQPQPWREIDSVAAALNLAASLSRSWNTDLMREHIAAQLGKTLLSDVFPDHSAFDVPVADVPASVPQAEKTSGANLGNEAFQDSLLAEAFLPAGMDSQSGIGSNNWVVNGSHTKSGKPLLANDPHLGHSIPSVWYMIHLKAPGLNVTGVSLPGLPLVIIGHNEHIAWGATNTGADVQDLYVESFNVHDPKKYLHNGQWVDADIRDEVIKVRNRPDYHFTVTVTRHGPVISHDGDRHLALQWTLLSPHAVGLPFLHINQASNWQEFTAALRDFKVPMQNFVYADAEGNIGFYAAGLVPARKHGNGAVPVPGSTDDFDWPGFIPFDDLPHSFNPPSGMIATANGRIVPDNYPYFITAKWEAPFRTARIFQLLRDGGNFTSADMLRIQTDIMSLEDKWLANQLLAAAEKHPPSSPDAQFALGVLKSWDGEARMDSAATLALEVTRSALLARILKPKLGDDLSDYHWPMSTIFLQNVLEQNLTRWLPPGDTDFYMTLMKSLEEGVRQIPALVHSQNHTAWKWGNTIPLTFHHPLSGGLPFLGRWLDVGPFPQAGTGTTVKQTTPHLGPSMRMVVDFSDLDHSMQNITLGESGQVSSPYYRDQFPAWYNGKSIPMLFSDAAVEKGEVHKLVLEPGR